VADTRDNEPNPNRGLWTELFFVGAPGFFGNDNPYTAMVFTHRQYFTIIKKYLTFACRINYQTTLSGEAPWYMLAFKPDTYVFWDGLGGAKTLRGIMRNRIVGEGSLMGNFEFRWKFLNFNFIGREWYIALNPFMDAGLITKKYDKQPNLTGVNEEVHLSYGMGLRAALNQNFIVALDYGFAADKQDGSSGMYIGLGYLF
jgi:outer membrane protein assembly factor BamA